MDSSTFTGSRTVFILKRSRMALSEVAECGPKSISRAIIALHGLRMELRQLRTAHQKRAALGIEEAGCPRHEKARPGSE